MTIISNWSPNYLSATPYHLQLKNIMLKAIEDGRFSYGAFLPDPQKVAVRSLFQRAYAIKAYDLLVKEGTLAHVTGRGYCLVRKTAYC